MSMSVSLPINFTSKKKTKKKPSVYLKLKKYIKKEKRKEKCTKLHK